MLGGVTLQGSSLAVTAAGATFFPRNSSTFSGPERQRNCTAGEIPQADCGFPRRFPMEYTWCACVRQGAEQIKTIAIQ